MSTSKLLTSVLAVVALSATGAMAWPNVLVKKQQPATRTASAECCSVAPTKTADTATARATKATTRLVSADGFEYVGGDTGWQLAQHKFELRSGEFKHASDCPVSIAKAGGNLNVATPRA
jgi:hypothetical protein